MELLLASASPARRATLRAAGIEPRIAVSAVDEPAVLAAARSQGPLSPADAVLLLAQAKACDVARNHRGVLVLGCDSMLELDGEVVGKPSDAVDAVCRWQAMRGRTAVLHTGHWLIDGRDSVAPQPTTARSSDLGNSTEITRSDGFGATSSTTVHFAQVTDAEIEAYVATGEPLHVAGAFTIDGRGGPFVTKVEGDHHGVVGLSLPLLRDLLARCQVSVVDLWNLPD